jgi:hypothetical protein
MSSVSYERLLSDPRTSVAASKLPGDLPEHRHAGALLKTLGNRLVLSLVPAVVEQGGGKSPVLLATTSNELVIAGSWLTFRGAVPQNRIVEVQRFHHGVSVSLKAMGRPVLHVSERWWSEMGLWLKYFQPIPVPQPQALIEVPENPRDAEYAAAAHMRLLGFGDARVTSAGNDKGLDVVAAGAVAQVKWHETKVGAPAIRQLKGSAAPSDRMLFYSKVGYTPGAIEAANSSAMALFRLGGYEGAEPVNVHARLLTSHDTISRGAGRSIEQAFAQERLLDNTRANVRWLRARVQEQLAYGRGNRRRLAAAKSELSRASAFLRSAHEPGISIAAQARHLRYAVAALSRASKLARIKVPR